MVDNNHTESETDESTAHKLSRRKILGRSAASLVTIPAFGASTVAATDEDPSRNPRRDEELEGDANDVTQLNRSNSMSQKQFEAFVRRTKNKYEDDFIGTIDPRSDEDDTASSDLSTQTSPNVRNLSFVRAWNSSYEVRSTTLNVKLAETDHSLALFRAPRTDPDGKNVYFFWHWSQSVGNRNVLQNPRTTFIRNRVRLSNSRDELVKFNPNSPLSVAGQTYTISLSASVSGLSVGISGSFELFGGTVLPEPGQVQLGGGGRYSVSFDGCQPGAVGLNAATEVRTPRTISRSDVSWTNRVECNTFCL